MVLGLFLILITAHSKENGLGGHRSVGTIVFGDGYVYNEVCTGNGPGTLHSFFGVAHCFQDELIITKMNIILVKSCLKCLGDTPSQMSLYFVMDM
jgi:hypothetical protein